MKNSLQIVALVVVSALCGCSEDDEGYSTLARIEPQPVAGCKDESYALCNTESTACQATIFSTVVCLRGNQGATMPVARRISLDEFGAELTAAETDEPTMSSEQLNALERGLVLMRLLGVGDLTGTGFVDSQKETVPAFYDSDADVVTFVRQDNGSLLNEQAANLTLAHEYVHALQDQEHDLNRLLDEYGATLDGSLAFQSVVEGEASMHEDAFLAALWGMDQREVSFEARYTQQESLAAANLTAYSPLLAISRSFPYYLGGIFVYRAFSKGGMAQVRQLYVQPPTSTLEIRTGIPAIPVLADPPAPPSGYELLSVDTMGSELFFDFVEASLPNGVNIEAFRNEWRGDRAYLYFRPGTADVAVLWRIKLPNAERRATLRVAFPQAVSLEDDVLVVLTSDVNANAITTGLLDNVTKGNVIAPSTSGDDLVQAARMALKTRLLPDLR